MADLDTLDLPILISRKICVTEKFCNLRFVKVGNTGYDEEETKWPIAAEMMRSRRLRSLSDIESF